MYPLALKSLGERGPGVQHLCDAYPLALKSCGKKSKNEKCDVFVLKSVVCACLRNAVYIQFVSGSLCTRPRSDDSCRHAGSVSVWNTHEIQINEESKHLPVNSRWSS